MDRAWLSSVMWPRMPSSRTATGWVKSSVLAAPVKMLGVAQVGVQVGGRALGGAVSCARAWVSTTGSLSTYTIRESGAARCATWWVLFEGRQAGADIQELAGSRLGGQVTYDPAQEGPVGAGDGDDVGRWP